MLMLRLAAVFTIALSSSTLLGQSWRLDRAKLCFDRAEDNGRMNIHESWVRVSDYKVRLIGGQAVCVFVEPGNAEVVVTSTIPYHPESKNDQACKSRVVKLELAPKENLTFVLEPASKGPTYVCGWRIQQIQTALNKSKKPDHP
jgi:hypothetical protein